MGVLNMEVEHIQQLEIKKDKIDKRLKELKLKRALLEKTISKTYRKQEISLLCGVARKLLNEGKISVSKNGETLIYIPVKNLTDIMTNERYKIVLDSKPEWQALVKEPD